MNNRRLLGISLAAMCAATSLLAEPAEVAVARGPEALVGKISGLRGELKSMLQELLDASIAAARKGELPNISVVVRDKTAEFEADWAEVQRLHAEYEAAREGFDASKAASPRVLALRQQIAEVKVQMAQLEANDTSFVSDGEMAASARGKAETERKIAGLEADATKIRADMNADYDEMERLQKSLRITKAKLANAKRRKVSDTSRLEDAASSVESQTVAARGRIKKAETMLENIKQDIANLRGQAAPAFSPVKAEPPVEDRSWAEGFSDLSMGVDNFFTNMTSPLYAVNHLLQGEMDAFFQTSLSFVINTVFGGLGLVDMASGLGLENKSAWFNQTLATWGIESGPYLVLPFFGSSSFRGMFGIGTDFMINPVGMIVKNDKRHTNRHMQQRNLYLALWGVQIITEREKVIEFLEDLQKNSLDMYAAMRNVTYQRDKQMEDDIKARSKN